MKHAAAKVVLKLHNFEQKQQKSQNHPNGSVQKSQNRKKKPRQVQSNVKVLLTTFFDCNYEFLPQDRMVNKENYLELIRQKLTEL